MTTGITRVDRFERRTSGHWPCWRSCSWQYAWPILQPDISPFWRHACAVVDILIWVVFVAEFIARLVLAERRPVRRQARSDVLMVALRCFDRCGCSGSWCCFG
jgi:hypothetical protein